MLDALINSRHIWYGNPETVQVLDGNGDFTGEYETRITHLAHFRANVSPARGNAHEDYFGASLDYTATLSTANMRLPLDEQTLIWDEKPQLDEEGQADPLTAKYRIVAVARGHYQRHFALKELKRKGD